MMKSQNKKNYLSILLIQIKQNHLGVTSGLVAAFIILCRFAYIPYLGDNDIEGDFWDWKWLSSFLYTVGVEVSFLCFAFILHWATNYMEGKPKKAFKVLSYSIAFVGFFFVSWIFLDEDKHNFNDEITISLISALLSVWVWYIIGKLVRSTISRYKMTLRYYNNLIFMEIPPMIKDVNVNKYEELKWDALDYATK